MDTARTTRRPFGQTFVSVVVAIWFAVVVCFGLKFVVAGDFTPASICGSLAIALATGAYLVRRRKFSGLIVIALAGILGPFALIPWLGIQVLFAPFLFSSIFGAIEMAAVDL